jgi:NADH-quinone oxidoreductase subunit C
MGEALEPTLADKAAVLERLSEHPAVKAIVAWNPDALCDARRDFSELTLTIAPDQIRAAAAALRDAGYNFFEDMTAVDWFPASPRFQLSYHILSHAFKERIRLRVVLDEAESSVQSITPVWPSANFFEREVFDLFGIRFEGHPNLRRIMLPDDWQGHPLRKDYPVEGYR